MEIELFSPGVGLPINLSRFTHISVVFHLVEFKVFAPDGELPISQFDVGIKKIL